MTAVTQADNTLLYIRQKVRRLTASASEASLSTDDIDQYINRFYDNDFPYAIKLDQTRSVYKFITIPNVDRYPTDVNNNMGYRAPIYVEGVQGNFFKDRQQFFNLYPRYPTQMQQAGGDGNKVNFSFNLFGNTNSPFPQPNFGMLSTSIIIGGIDVNGNPIRVIDDGGAVVNAYGIGSNTTIGQLLFVNTNSVGNNVYLTQTPPLNEQKPAIPPLSPLGIQSPPGQQYPPLPLTPQYIGTVNYITSQFTFTLPVAPAAGTMLNVWCNQYVTGRPYSILFWNNEITVRPVPDNVYQIEIETYLTPTEFMLTTDSPILRQWAQYLAYGAACEILRDRQDMEGVENLKEGMARQEALVLERQSVEEIFQPNYQLFNSTTSAGGYSAGLGWGGF